MKSNNLLYMILILLLISFTHFSCKRDSSICFSVTGFKVDIHNLLKDGSTITQDLKGIKSIRNEVYELVEPGNWDSAISHIISWDNVTHDYSNNTLASFDVLIDGKHYSYPKNKCK